MFFKDTFVKRLNGLITKNKVTQKELADAIGISRPAISQFTSGTSLPSLDKLVALADYFSVSLDYLLGRNNAKDMQLFIEPDGELYYYFSKSGTIVPFHGSFKYSFGIYPGDKELKLFLYLEEQRDGKLMDPNILHSSSHLEFLSLVSLINSKLNFKYNPYERRNMDIIIPYKSSDGHNYQGIGIQEIVPACLYSIDYCNYVEQYLRKSRAEKVSFMADYVGDVLEQFNDWSPA